MENQKRRLNVRAMPAMRPSTAAPKQCYVYHWDRIFGALGIVLLLIGVAAYSVHLLLQRPDGPEAGGLGKATPSVAPTLAGTHKVVAAKEAKRDHFIDKPLPKLPDSAPSSAADSADDKATPKPALSPGVSEPEGEVGGLSPLRPVGLPTEDSSRSGTEKQTAVEGHQRPPIEAHAPETAANEAPANTAVDASVSQGSDSADGRKSLLRPAKNRNEALPPEPTESTTVAVATRDRGASTRLLKLQGTEVSSPSVKRFLLAKSVANNKPIGDLNSVRLNDNGVAAVYAFSDVVGMKNDFLFYEWFRNGKRVAKVRVGVWAKRWRSYSSKVLNERMRGSWRVELRNDEDRLLASADFRF